MDNLDFSSFDLPITIGKTFTRQRVVIDGNRFEDCNFEDCTIVYNGNVAVVSNCVFTPGTFWELREAAGMTASVLKSAGWTIDVPDIHKNLPLIRWA